MRSKVAAAIGLLVAMAATTASAGVVVSEDVVVSNQTGTHKSEQTVMVQGNKRKVITKDRIFITDLDLGRMFMLVPAKKQAGDVPFPPAGFMMTYLAQQGVSLEYKKAKGTRKAAGYDCQDYAGSQRLGRMQVEGSECVASAAAGAQEYVAFTKAMNAKLKGTPLQPMGDIADGIPVTSTVTISYIPYPVPKNFPPDLTAKYKADLAKQKPQVTRTTVTKIEVKDIPAAEFAIPAQYLKPTPTATPGAVASPAAKPAASAASH
jgi:hypothetical protein